MSKTRGLPFVVQWLKSQFPGVVVQFEQHVTEKNL